MSPVMKRIAAGKALGLVVGLSAMLWLWLAGATDPYFIWGMLAWSLTLGALIGIIGFYEHVPFVEIHIPVWLRGAWTGAWMGVVLVLLSYEQIAVILTQTPVLSGLVSSPWWAVLDAAIWGALIDVLITYSIGPVHWKDSGLSDLPEQPMAPAE